MKPLIFLLLALVIGLVIVLTNTQMSQSTSNIVTSVASRTSIPTIGGSTERETSPWIFQDSLCGVSCWGNITIESTSVDELIAYIKQDNMLLSVSDLSDLGVVQWEYNNGVHVTATLNREKTALPVSALLIRMPRHETLKQIIDYLGEPSHIAIAARVSPDVLDKQTDIFYEIYFIYLEKGIALHYVSTEPLSDAEISYNSLIDKVSIVEANSNSFASHLAINESQPILEWQGENSLIYYCNLAYPNSEICQ